MPAMFPNKVIMKCLRIFCDGWNLHNIINTNVGYLETNWENITGCCDLPIWGLSINSASITQQKTIKPILNQKRRSHSVTNTNKKKKNNMKSKYS